MYHNEISNYNKILKMIELTNPFVKKFIITKQEFNYVYIYDSSNNPEINKILKYILDVFKIRPHEHYYNLSLYKIFKISQEVHNYFLNLLQKYEYNIYIIHNNINLNVIEHVKTIEQIKSNNLLYINESQYENYNFENILNTSLKSLKIY